MAMVTGVVLAGGQGSRMGGVDKGLLLLAGRSLCEHVVARLRPQVAHLLINANRNAEAYAELGVPVLSDHDGDFAGPVAGILAGLSGAVTPYVAIVPCDAPCLPKDLVTRLGAALHQQAADIAVAHDGQRLQPVFALLRVELAASLAAYLAAGERKLDRWQQQHACAQVDFSDQAAAFCNINTPEDLAALAASWPATGADLP